MKALIFNGSTERGENSTSERLSTYLESDLVKHGVDTQLFKLADSGIPLFDLANTGIPDSVKQMNEVFQRADVHIWLTPLYHGSMTGAMKNCLDWLEISADSPKPYLSGKMIGLVCWADGTQAIQGINAMDSVAKALRAWTLPYSVSIKRDELFDASENMTAAYQQKFQIMLQLLIDGPDRNN